jgi:hypothetical protein
MCAAQESRAQTYVAFISQDRIDKARNVLLVMLAIGIERDDDVSALSQRETDPCLKARTLSPVYDVTQPEDV